MMIVQGSSTMPLPTTGRMSKMAIIAAMPNALRMPMIVSPIAISENVISRISA
jgi:hypothetical protein